MIVFAERRVLLNTPKSNSEKRHTGRFRLFAVALGILPLVAVELGLRLFGGGFAQHDPYSEFAGNVPVFELDGDEYRTAKQREPYLASQTFPVAKADNTFRIFCFGGSTVHGRPYQTDTAFPAWLKIELGLGNPELNFEVINCGGISYASFRIAPMIREVTQYEPDLIILATGHNEFLEDRTYQNVKKRGWLRERLDSLHVVRTGRKLIAASPSPKKTESTEFNTRLDAANGYASYQRDPDWHTKVAEQFRSTLTDIADTCAQSDVPLAFVTLGSNLRDCPPFKSVLRQDLTAEDERSWIAHFELGSQLEKTNAPSALEAYRDAFAIDENYALLSYRIARQLDRSDQVEANTFYRRALADDICPLRMLPAQRETLESVASEYGLLLVNAEIAIADTCLNGIPGFDRYVDHVHPTIEGHQIIATAIANRLNETKLLPLQLEKIEAQRTPAFTQHIEELPPRYFADGRRRVHWLESWARRERLADEIAPQTAAEFIRSGTRAMDFADYEIAHEAFARAIEIDAVNTTEKLKKHVTVLRNQGREAGSMKLTKWLLGEFRR